MRILYISQYFPPEMGAPAARVSELSRFWVQQGHQVTVLTAFPNHPTGVVPPEYRGKRRRLVVREWWEGVRIVRTWLLPFPNRKPLERMLNYASFWLSASLTGIFLARPDVLIATSPQLLVGLTGWWLGFVKRVPFVLEIRDLWPESLAAVGVARERSMLTRALGPVARFLYRRSDHIVVVSPAFKERIVRQGKISPDKISVVENGVDTALFSGDGESHGFRESLGLEGKFIVSYVGTLGMAHGLSTVLDAAASLQHSNPEIMFLMVGEGAEKEHLQNQVGARGLSNVSILPQQPREKIAEMIRASTLGVVPLRKAEVFQTVIPTKMLEFMACGRPVILGVDGQARTLLEKAGAGVFVEPENAGELTRAILELGADAARCQQMGQNGRDYVERNLSRESLARDYLHVLEDLRMDRDAIRGVAGRRE
ncbi:MAG: glycosyltransferase family 4 protein [Terriglobales bacterium]